MEDCQLGFFFWDYAGTHLGSMRNCQSGCDMGDSGWSSVG